MRIFINLVRNIGLRVHARKEGLTRREASALVEKCNEEHIKKAVAISGVQLPPEFTAVAAGEGLEAIGDGSLIKAIIAWLKTDNGQAFIKILFMILMGLL